VTMKLISRLKRCMASRVRKAWRRLQSLCKSPLTFDELDVWSKLELFDRLPMSDLIRDRLVCREWDQLSRIACRGRRSLTLVMNPDANEGDFYTYEPKDVLVISQLDRAIAEYLASTFPNITQLEVFNISPEHLGHMQHLLEHWGP